MGMMEKWMAANPNATAQDFPQKVPAFVFNELKNNNIDKTIQSHLDPDNEVTKALQQAKDSADLANETNKVKETLKTTAEDSLKDENNLESQPNKNIEISKNEDNMSSTKL